MIFTTTIQTPLDILSERSDIKNNKDLHALIALLHKSPSNMIKLVTLGDYGTGKTTAIQYMQTKRKPKAVIIPQPTIGVTISEHKFASKNIVYKVWDFSGHHEYCVFYPNLMSHNYVIYLLFVSLVRPWEEQIEYWTQFLKKTINYGSPEKEEFVSVILVGTKLDMLKPSDIAIAEREFQNYCIENRFNSYELISTMAEFDRISRLRESIVDVGLGIVSQMKIAHYDLAVLELINKQKKDIIYKGIDTTNLYNIRCLSLLHNEPISKNICLKPDLLSKIVGMFIGPPEHRDILSAFRVVGSVSIYPLPLLQSLLQSFMDSMAGTVI